MNRKSSDAFDLSLYERIARIMERESRDWSSPKSGAVLHKIDWPTAKKQASILLQAAVDHNVPLAYAMGGLRQESAFDPNAQNPNGYPGVFVKTDWGIAQVSGNNLVGMFSGDEERAKTFALDPAWAIPFACKNYRALLDWAKERYPQSSPTYVGAMAYNKGRTGTEIILSLKPRPGQRGYETIFRVLKQAASGRIHAAKVMSFTYRFRDELNLESP